MLPQDLIYKHVFSNLMADGLNQKHAGDYAARAVFLWKRGRGHDQAIKTVMLEAKKIKRA